jgi:hypothetical protein
VRYSVQQEISRHEFDGTKHGPSEGRESESVKRNLHWQLATFACLLNGFFPEVDGLDPSSGSCTYPVVLPCMAAGCPVTISAHI